MTDGCASGKSHPIAGHEECYVVPEMVRIAVLPVPEWYGIRSALPPMLVYIALVMYFKTDHRIPSAHMLENCHLVRVLVPRSIHEFCFPVMPGILCYCIGNLPYVLPLRSSLHISKAGCAQSTIQPVDSLSRKVLSSFMSGSP